MKTTLAFIPVLLVVALVGCGDSKSTADNTEAEQLKDKIASLEKELEAKQEPDSEADTIPEAEERKKPAKARSVKEAQDKADSEAEAKETPSNDPLNKAAQIDPNREANGLFVRAAQLLGVNA